MSRTFARLHEHSAGSPSPAGLHRERRVNLPALEPLSGYPRSGMRTLADRLLYALVPALAVLLASAPLSLLAGQPAGAGGGPDGGQSAAVQVGDRVVLSMFTAAGEQLVEVSGTRTVGRNGQIFLPYVGSVEVEGLSASEIRDLLAERYTSFYSSPVIDVEAQIRVNVTGAVRQPGNFYLAPTSTVVDALATAGGATSEVDFSGYGGAADLGRVRLVRDGQSRVLDLRPDAAESELLQLLVQSGDWLHVPPQPSSRWRSNLQLLSGLFSVAGSIAALVILIGS